MTLETGIDWEDAFANASHIADGMGYPAKWAARAEAFRARWPHRQLDIAYGNAPRETLDLFRPETTPKGLVIFIHGGFWKSMEKGLWSDLAEGPLRNGWAVAMPGYTLAPEARISAITAQIGAAITHAATLIDGPLRLTGHSAGGHLATRMICRDTPLPPAITARTQAVLSLSGVHDLRPLRLNAMNTDLRLDAAEAEAESPALNTPLPGIKTTCWTGAAERPEFLRQAGLLYEAWKGHTDMQPTIFATARHHFDVIDPLQSADSALTQTLLG